MRYEKRPPPREQETSVAGEAIELGDQEHGVPGATGGQGGDELRAINALAALHLLDLRQQRAADVGGHVLARRLKAKAGGPLIVYGDMQVANKARTATTLLESHNESPTCSCSPARFRRFACR